MYAFNNDHLRVAMLLPVLKWPDSVKILWACGSIKCVGASDQNGVGMELVAGLFPVLASSVWMGFDGFNAPLSGIFGLALAVCFVGWRKGVRLKLQRPSWPMANEFPLPKVWWWFLMIGSYGQVSRKNSHLKQELVFHYERKRYDMPVNVPVSSPSAPFTIRQEVACRLLPLWVWFESFIARSIGCRDGMGRVAHFFRESSILITN